MGDLILPPPPVMPPAPSPQQAPNGRDERGRFAPGMTGNPAGRPVVAAEIKKLAREYTLVAMKRLIKIIEDDNHPGQTHVAAISLLWDRGYGKPVQQIEAGGPGAFDDMDDEALQAYVAAKARKFIEG
jgi:hypothetical protein